MSRSPHSNKPAHDAGYSSGKSLEGRNGPDVDTGPGHGTIRYDPRGLTGDSSKRKRSKSNPFRHDGGVDQGPKFLGVPIYDARRLKKKLH